eukprot:362982-Chlamydomonas_euryale.AAC.16
MAWHGMAWQGVRYICCNWRVLDKFQPARRAASHAPDASIHRPCIGLLPQEVFAARGARRGCCAFFLYDATLPVGCAWRGTLKSHAICGGPANRHRRRHPPHAAAPAAATQLSAPWRCPCCSVASW